MHLLDLIAFTLCISEELEQNIQTLGGNSSLNKWRDTETISRGFEGSFLIRCGSIAALLVDENAKEAVLLIKYDGPPKMVRTAINMLFKDNTILEHAAGPRFATINDSTCCFVLWGYNDEKEIV